MLIGRFWNEQKTCYNKNIGRKSNKNQRNRRPKRLRQVFLTVAVVLLAVLLVFLGVWAGRAVIARVKKSHADTTNTAKIAKIEIELLNITADELKLSAKTEKFGKNVAILTDEQGKTVVAENLEIKLRGNTTFLQDKKPFQLKFETKLDVFGLGEAKKWVLRSNSLDPSYLRDDTAMTIAEMLGEKYANRGKFVELYLDGEYEGLYYLLHKIDVGKGSVNLRDAGGVLVELDTLHSDEGGCYWTHLTSCLKLVESVVEDEESEAAAMTAFLSEFDRLEMAAETGDFATVAEVADVESLAQYFLISEFTVNPDAYASSFCLYKDGAEDKIHAGPVWDFDFALGNLEWWWGKEIDGYFDPDSDQIRRAEAFLEEGESNISKLLYLLIDIPEFRAEVERVWQEQMSGRGVELVKSIQNTAESIRAAAVRDAEKWGEDENENGNEDENIDENTDENANDGEDENEPLQGDFDAEVEYLLDWVRARYVFMEKTYGNPTKVITIS